MFSVSLRPFAKRAPENWERMSLQTSGGSYWKELRAVVGAYTPGAISRNAKR